MNYVFDTNILVHLLTGSDKGNNARAKMADESSFIIISIVTKAEILSIAKQRKWGIKKRTVLDNLMDELLVIPIDNDRLIQVYTEIDAYSQGNLEGKPLATSARNMGKNDLWIAATAHLTNAVLLTTDKDFAHLDTIYFKIDNLE